MKILKSLILYLILSQFCLAQSEQNKLLENAKSLMASERFGEAIELLNRYVAINPQSAEGFNLRGICNEKRGNFEQAVYDYRTAIKISPDDNKITENLKRAENDWYRLLYNKIEGYKREIAINPSVPGNYLEIGKCYKNLGEWSEAEIWYDLYLEKEEASADEILRYTEILAKNNHIQKGEAYLKKYIEKFSDDHRLWSRYGYFLYWLGKLKLSEKAFEKAVEIRPYFKEALDGLDLVKGKKNVYTSNDLSFRYGKNAKVYLIDKYLKSLETNPDNDQLRFKLIDELIKYKRIEEAYQQLELLKSKYSNQPDFQKLYSSVLETRNQLIDDEITKLNIAIQKDPNDKNSLLKLSELLIYRNRIFEAISLLENYLNENNDDEIRFLLAKYYLWNSNLCESKQLLEILVQKRYSNPEAELLLAKIYLWLDTELQKAEYLFEKYLSEYPGNKDAVLGLIETKLKLTNYFDAEKIIFKNDSLFTITESEYLKNRVKEAEKNKKISDDFKILEEARASVQIKDYQAAIRKYSEFLKIYSDNIQVKTELAEAYSANSEFGEAIRIYSYIITQNYDYELDKRRAKNIFWSKDYFNSVQEFKRLTLKNPDDVECKLFLADSYLFNGENDKSRKIYYELINQAPESYILNQRLAWLGDKSLTTGFNYSVQLVPSVNYFNDNQNFTYAGQSFLIRKPFTNFFAIGGAIHRGGLSSQSEERTLYTVKGMLYLSLTESIKSEASFGQIFFNTKEKQFLGELNFSISKPGYFAIGGFYKRTDASLELYSPLLVGKRMYLNLAKLNLSINPGFNFILNTTYQLILPEDKNLGHQISLRVGNNFIKSLSAGYEFYYYNFKNSSSLYWSPENYISHSLWSDWQILKLSQSNLKFGGKVGFIPENNFVLSEAYIDFNYHFIQNFSLNIFIAGGKTYRVEFGGYNSFSIISSLLISI
ncbi:MAG: tetratricopeptide repeat protein [Ignavibacterium album]|uniref:tetratricopeptide repeat protein n=1 Tax=Ignavibacterium album TaxID=591197 RepID=UPI0026EFADA8|nr:tetratricopeptide repeat protein [Ignavibacterium album]MCX8105666.1 tetratricopeptide repeat protein [Ignavibacterium album]